MREKQRGYTLIEAIVYLIVALFVIMYAMRSMSNMSDTYVQYRSISKVQLTARDAINVMARHTAGAGLKYILRIDSTGASPAGFYVMFPDSTPKADSTYKYLDSVIYADSSSIQHTEGATVNGKNRDALSLLKLVPNETGDSISYLLWLRFVVDNTDRLWLRSDTMRIAGTPGVVTWSGGNSTNYDSLLLQTNVKHMQFAYSINGFDWVKHPDSLGSATGERLVRFIKMGIVVATEKEVGTKSKQRDFDFFAAEYGGAPNYYPKTTADSLRVHRFYEQIVEVPNNGIF